MRSLIVTALMAFLVSAVPAQEFTSPDDLLSSLYSEYLSGRAVTNFEPYFSDRLTAEMDGARVPREALRRLGFDPITGMGQRRLMTVFNLENLATEGLTATSMASFRADGELFTIEFGLVREDRHGWQIDHISGKAGDVVWCTNDLVAAMRAARTP